MVCLLYGQGKSRGWLGSCLAAVDHGESLRSKPARAVTALAWPTSYRRASDHIGREVATTVLVVEANAAHGTAALLLGRLGAQLDGLQQLLLHAEAVVVPSRRGGPLLWGHGMEKNLCPTAPSEGTATPHSYIKPQRHRPPSRPFGARAPGRPSLNVQPQHISSYPCSPHSCPAALAGRSCGPLLSLGVSTTRTRTRRRRRKSTRTLDACARAVFWKVCGSRLVDVISVLLKLRGGAAVEAGEGFDGVGVALVRGHSVVPPGFGQVDGEATPSVLVYEGEGVLGK